ncbi:MAG: hypothetical protein K8953_12910, partial [Proteobacteria bacterium]|nr:hypothetical protein [Pseudomonadota bacterium]
IIGGNANDASCDSANELDSCIKHPFSSGCEASLPEHYQQARANRLAFCRTAGNAGNELCTVDTTFAHICTNYPFDAQCLGDNDYTLIRRDACSGDPFATRCTGDVYNDLRESACASNPNSSRCSGTLARVCGGNPFDTLCRNTTVYLNARINICRGNPLDGRCGWTISTICNSNPFDTVCGNPGWNNAREIACRGGTATAGQCRDVIAGVCGANPFDTLCGDSGWNNARASACRNGSTNTQCGGIIAGVCGNNPFDSLCGGSYTQNRRNACSDDPFTPRCAGNVYNDLRVSFCEDNVGTHPSCPAPTPQVTASVCADSFALPLAHGATAADRRNKFLIGRATNLDTGGLTP